MQFTSICYQRNSLQETNMLKQHQLLKVRKQQQQHKLNESACITLGVGLQWLGSYYVCAFKSRYNTNTQQACLHHLGGGAKHHDVRLQTHFPGSNSSCPGMVGRKPAKRHHTITALLNGVCQEKFKLPYLMEVRKSQAVTRKQEGTKKHFSITLFPERVLPIRSSLLMDTSKPSGRPGRFQRWTGVGVMVSYNENITRS